MSQSSNENSNSSFTCHGAREILEISAGAVHIEKTIIALERAVEENPGLPFDLTKSLVESICKTILKDREDPRYDDSLELPKLVKYTAKKLKLIPENYSNTKVEQSFIQIINGMVTMIHGLCEIRNLEGTASHGKDSYKILYIL